MVVALLMIASAFSPLHLVVAHRPDARMRREAVLPATEVPPIARRRAGEAALVAIGRDEVSSPTEPCNCLFFVFAPGVPLGILECWAG